MIEIPIIELDTKGFKLAVDTKIYSSEAIVATLYEYSDRYFIYQKRNDNNNEMLDVTFEAKEETTISKCIVKEFCNKLVEQQLRININKQFGHIRDMIVTEAFKPVNNKK